MLETDKQRRWWFANHPEYSADRKGKRSQPGERESKKPPKVPPEEVDSYVGQWIDYATELGSTLLKSFEKTFGTASLKTGDPNDPQAEEALKKAFIEMMMAAGHTDRERLETIWKRAESTKSQARIMAWAMQTKGFFSSLKSFPGGVILNATKKKRKRPPPRLPPRGTSERAKINRDRDKGVKARKAQELADILAGGRGSGVWTDKELKDIRKTKGFPIDAQWHHDPTVANRPDLAADPRVVHIIRGGRKAHLEIGHNKNWRNPTK